MDYIDSVTPSRTWAGQGRGTRLARVLLLISALKSAEASASFLNLGASGKLHVPVKRQASSDQVFNWTSVCFPTDIMTHIE